jgi:hypothetical protein
MSIKIGSYNFEGPYADTSHLRNEGGIYGILDQRSGGQFHVVDVGESDGVRSRVENHDRSECWNRNRQGNLTVAVYYTPGLSLQQRRSIEAALREQYSPACGVR